MQVFAEGSGDVPDNDDGVCLVILKPDATHSPNDDNSPAATLAERILAQREAGPRVNPNLVVFLAAAANRLAELRATTRMFLARKSIVGDQAMNLTAHQQRQADSKLAETSKQVDSLIAETFTLALTPSKQPGQRDINWQTTRVTAAGGLAERTSDKLASEEQLIGTYSGVRIRIDLDRRNLWSQRGDIAVHKLWERYAWLGYMPRLASRDVLYNAIANRDSTITWLQDTLAYAETHDDERWVGVVTAKAVAPGPSGLPTRPDRVPAPGEQAKPGMGEPPVPPDGPDGPTTPLIVPPEPGSRQPTQFYARFSLDPVRCIKPLGEIADHVSSKLEDEVELGSRCPGPEPGGLRRVHPPHRLRERPKPRCGVLRVRVEESCEAANHTRSARPAGQVQRLVNSEPTTSARTIALGLPGGIRALLGERIQETPATCPILRATRIADVPCGGLEPALGRADDRVAAVATPR